MNILITGFKPFGSHQTNVTELILDGYTYDKPQIHTKIVILPVVFNDIEKMLQDAIKESQPDLIIHLGEQAKAEGIELERVAINIIDAPIPDNAGHQPIDKPIIEHGKTAYFSTLPLRQIESKLTQHAIPTKFSNTAGTYICNHLFYISMAEQDKNKNQIPTGFVHIPLINEQNQRSNFDIKTLRKALTLTLDACINEQLKNV